MKKIEQLSKLYNQLKELDCVAMEVGKMGNKILSEI